VMITGTYQPHDGEVRNTRGVTGVLGAAIWTRRAGAR
jgi:hypothetical protein